MRILHLSDCHLPRDCGPDADGVDARVVLEKLLHDCRHLPGLDLVVVSGDVADDGSPEGYRDARALIGGFALERGVPAVFCTGNHDDRQAFAASLGSGHLDGAGRDVGQLLPGGSGHRAAVSYAAGYRIVTLDSLVPGKVHGQIDPAQLAWLRAVLAAPYRDGSVVLLHHPPIALKGTVQEQVGLRNAHALAAALEGSDARIVLCGHFHLQLAGRLGAVPLCHTVHARDPRAGEQVYLVDSASGADVPAEEPAQAMDPEHLGHDDRSLELADLADAEPLLALREAAAAWLAARGVRQWEPGEVTLAEVREQVEAGQWHVLRENAMPVAGLRLLWEDEEVWGPQPPVAAYVHGLMVAEQHRGAGLGASLLRWAAAQALARRRSLLRLDCGEDNEALRSYYAQQGFGTVGRRISDGRWYSVVLLERPLQDAGPRA